MISVGCASIGAWVQGSALILAFYRPSLMNIMLYLGRWIAGLRFPPLAAVPPRIPLKTAFVLGDSYLRGTRKGSRDFSVKCGEDRAVCQSELREMAIRSLLCVDHPGGETGDVTVVGDKCERASVPALTRPNSCLASTTVSPHWGAWASTRTNPSSVMAHVASSGVPFLAKPFS
jgi:hypothetical protein